jgi:hypothetical protein
LDKKDYSKKQNRGIADSDGDVGLTRKGEKQSTEHDFLQV